MSDTDLELLARYSQQHAEDAFAEVVHRHIDLVHSAALRQVRSPELAEEVAQSTFMVGIGGCERNSEPTGCTESRDSVSGAYRTSLARDR